MAMGTRPGAGPDVVAVTPSLDMGLSEVLPSRSGAVTKLYRLLHFRPGTGFSHRDAIRVFVKITHRVIQAEQK